jgi:membrane fusion protein (multidrug efflux system)
MLRTTLRWMAFWRGWRRGPRRAVKWGVIGVLALGGGVGGYLYYRHSIHYPSTNDAYVKADVVQVAPQVTGRVLTVPVSDQQSVPQGRLLFRIDPAPFRYRLRQVQAKLALARQTVAADEAAVEAAHAGVADRQAQLKNARRQYRRAKDLAARNLAPQSQLDDARARRDSAAADLNLARADLHEAEVRLGSDGGQNPRIRQAQAAVDRAELDLAHTRITAPCGGRLSGVKLQPGDTVHADDPQFALVCSTRFWVYANYKETGLARVRPGQVATVRLDMYPGHPFHGIVESVNPASGAAFSLLPPENATGNWVKVTQRVPVRILIVNDTTDYPLSVQTSAEVTLDTGPGAGPAGRPRGHDLSDTQALALARRMGLVGAGTDAHEQMMTGAAQTASAH